MYRRCEACYLPLSEEMGPRALYCDAACRQRAYRVRRGLSSEAGTLEYSRCEHCSRRFSWERSRAGQERLYCSAACSQGAYRARVKAKEQKTREKAERARERRKRSTAGGSSSTSSGSGSYSSAGSAGGAGSSWAGSGSWRSGRSTGDHSSAGGTRDTHFGRRSSMTESAARTLLFHLSGLVDDGQTPLRKAYRTAARLLHPDMNPGGDPLEFKRLERAASVLRDCGHKL